MARLLLDTTDTSYTISNNNVTVFGSSGTAQSVTIASGVTGAILDGAVETVNLAGNAAAFTYKQVGTVLEVYSGATKVVDIPANALTGGGARQLAFSDGTVDVGFTAGSTTIELGGKVVSKVTNEAVVPTTIDATATSTASTTTTTTTVTPNFTATTGKDLLSGTDADEVFNAHVGTNTVTGALADTYQSVDVIDGLGGTDTLNISISSAAAAVGPVVSGVEKINFTGYVAQALDMSNTSGLTGFTNLRSIVATSLTNASELFGLDITNVNNQSTTIAYSATVNTLLTDTINIGLNNASNQAQVTLTDGANEIENIIVTTTGAASTIDLGGTAINGATSLTVKGDQDFSFDATDNTTAMAGLTTLDAATFTGKLDADLGAMATVIAVTGGDKDDTLTMLGLTNADNINLAAGSDTLVVNAADAESVTTEIALAGIETIDFNLNTDNDNASEDSSFRMSGADKLATVKLGLSTAATAATEGQLTLTQLPSTFTTLALNADGATADDRINDAVLTYSTAAATGSDTSLAVTVTNKDAQGNLINASLGVQFTVEGITANGVENITITTDQLNGNTVGTAGITADGGANITLNADSLTTLTLVSPTLLDLDGAALDDNIRTITASDADGGVFLNLASIADAGTTAAADRAITVTLGDGADVITNYAGDVQTNVIVLGGGNDSFDMDASDFHTATAGVETITIDAGAGNDTISVSDSTTLVAEGTISITTGTGVDTITIEGAFGNQTGVTVTDFTVGSGGDKIDFATSAAAGLPNLSLYVETAGALINNGFTNYTGNDLSALTVAAAATAFAAAGVVDGTTAGEIGYIVAGTGSDAGLFQFSDAAGTSVVTAAELVLLVTLTGVSDTALLDSDNFSDFLS